MTPLHELYGPEVPCCRPLAGGRRQARRSAAAAKRRTPPWGSATWTRSVAPLAVGPRHGGPHQAQSGREAWAVAQQAADDPATGSRHAPQPPPTLLSPSRTKSDLDLRVGGLERESRGGLAAAVLASAQTSCGTLKQRRGQEGVAEGTAECGGEDPPERAMRGRRFVSEKTSVICPLLCQVT